VGLLGPLLGYVTLWNRIANGKITDLPRAENMVQDVTEISAKSSVFCNVTSCSPPRFRSSFGATNWLHLQSRWRCTKQAMKQTNFSTAHCNVYKTTRRHVPEHLHRSEIMRSKTWVINDIHIECDRLCGLMVRVPSCRYRGPGSIPGATRVSEK
jgi:hypothetical protein